MIIRSERTYLFPVDPPTLWSRLARVDQYPTWWPWLRNFDARQLGTGQVWTCTVKPPIPWSVTIRVRITDAVEPTHVEAEVEGEVTGSGHLDITAHPDGSRLHLATSLAPSSPVLRAAGLLAAPISRFGHDWVLDAGARQFRAHLSS